MRQHRLTVILISVLLILSSYASAALVDHIVAVVNNEAITDRDVSLAMRHTIKAGGKAPSSSLSRKEALDTLIQDKLLAQAMGKMNIAVNEDDINRAIRNIMHQYGMTSIDQLRAVVAKQGMTFDQYRENMKQHIQQMKFMNQEVGSQVKISDQDLEDYYRQHMKKFGGTSAVHIAEILFPIAPNMTQEQGHLLEEKVKDVMKKLNRSNFRQMAQKYSGGDLGIVDPKTLPSEISSAIIPMKSGDISDPIITKNAIAIVMVIDRGEATDKDYERLKDQIYSILYDQRMQDALKAFVAQLRQNAYVQINE